MEQAKETMGGSHPKSWLRFFAKKARIFRNPSLSATNRRPKRRGSPKTWGTQKSYPLLFFENGQTTNQEMHNHKVNENHKTKHDLLIMRFWVIEVCSEMQKLPVPFWGKPQSRFWVRTALTNMLYQQRWQYVSEVIYQYRSIDTDLLIPIYKYRSINTDLIPELGPGV